MKPSLLFVVAALMASALGVALGRGVPLAHACSCRPNHQMSVELVSVTTDAGGEAPAEKRRWSDHASVSAGSFTSGTVSFRFGVKR